MEHFKYELETRSKGEIEVRLFPASTLCGEEDMSDHVRRGTVEVGLMGGLLRKEEPRVTSMEMPFLLKNWEHARKVYMGDGPALLLGDYSRRTNVQVKGFFANGFRHISSRFPVRKLVDFKDLKLRVPLNDVFIRTFRALGSQPVPVPLSEMYIALKERVVNGQDNPLSTVRGMNLPSVQANILETSHMFSAAAILVNGRFFKSLPRNLQTLFDECLAASVLLNWELAEQDDIESKKDLLAAGMFLWPVDEALRAELKKAMEPVYIWFYEEVPGSAAFEGYCRLVENSL